MLKPSTLDPTQPNGLLVPPWDIPAAARALEFLILNPVARQQIGEEARKKIEADLTWDAVAKKYLERFEEASLLKRFPLQLCYLCLEPDALPMS
jgi:glycosyltransferase involved in cell wall biosynthesis